MSTNTDVSDILDALLYEIYRKEVHRNERSDEDVFMLIVTLGRVALVAMEFQPFVDYFINYPITEQETE